MKKPFTLYASQASIPLRQVASRPFVPACAMPFADGQHCHYFVGDGCQLAYRWHDAFDVYVAVLEARLAAGLSIPVGSHLSDLYLVYQLQGESLLVPQHHHRAPTIHLHEGQRMEVYTPPDQALLQLQPAQPSLDYTLAAIVPKSGWVTRHPTLGESPMENLILLLKERYAAHRYLQPSPITPAMRAWLHVLLTTPAYGGMRLDDALNRPMVRLINEHRSEHRRSERKKNDLDFIEAARLLARQEIKRMDGGNPPTISTIAKAMDLSERRIRHTHIQHYQQRFVHYIHACRIDEAEARLRRGLSVSAVAYQLGWSDIANFSRQFKKHKGVPPSRLIEK